MKQIQTDMALAMYRGREMMKPLIPMSPGSDDLIIKELTAVNGDKVEVTYSEVDHRTSAYVVDISGDKKEVKREDMPKELKEIHDPMVFSAFLRDVYARTSTLSNGDVRFDVCGRLNGGMLRPSVPVKLDIGKIQTFIAKGGQKLDEEINSLLAQNPTLRGTDPNKIKEAVVVLGQTRTGKSTLLNLLAGVPMRVGMEGTRKTFVAEPGHELMFKTSAKYESCTTIPKAEVLDGKVYIDCPGFGETRGLEQELQNAFCIHNLFSRLESIKVLVVVPHTALAPDQKGQSLKDLAADLKRLINDYSITKTKSIAAVVVGSDRDCTPSQIVTDLDALSAEVAHEDADLGDFFGCIGNKFKTFKKPHDGPLPVDERSPILEMLNSPDPRQGTKFLPISAIHPEISVSKEAFGQLHDMVHQEVGKFIQNVGKATEQVIEGISKLSKSGLEKLHTDINNINKDNIVELVKFINDKFEKVGVDFDGVARVIDFVKSIDPRIVEDEQQTIHGASERLIKDVAKAVDIELEKRRLEDDRQKAIREADEAKKIADELEGKKAWRTVGIAAVTGLMGVLHKGIDKTIDVVCDRATTKVISPITHNFGSIPLPMMHPREHVVSMLPHSFRRSESDHSLLSSHVGLPTVSTDDRRKPDADKTKL